MDTFLKNAGRAVEAFARTEQVKNNPKLLMNLKTCLKRYVFPFLKIQAGTSEQFEEGLTKLTIKRLLEVETDFSKICEQALSKGTSKGTMDTYRSAFGRFLKWVKEQEKKQQEQTSPKYAPRQYTQYNWAASRKGKRKYNSKPYGLTDADLTPKLVKQIEDLHQFLTAKHFLMRQDAPLRETTWKSNRRRILSFLGWVHRYQSVPIEELDLAMIADVKTLDQFAVWGINVKGNQYRWAQDMGTGSLNVAKWLYHHESKKPEYRDIEVIEEIRIRINRFQRYHETSGSVPCTAENLICWSKLPEVVTYLRECTAPCCTNSNNKRPDHVVMQAWQRYLVITILTYCPIRQREIRELEFGKTLFRDDEGYIVKLEPCDHKTGSKTNKGREFRLPELITEGLDIWLRDWRPKVQTEHNCVFVLLSRERLGEPMDATQISRFVKRTMHRSTGVLFGTPKNIRPQDFRRISITWLWKLGNQETKMAFVEMIGTSMEVADKIYAQLTGEERTAKAKDWWKLA